MTEAYIKPCVRCGATERGAVPKRRHVGPCLACARKRRAEWFPKPPPPTGTSVKPCIQCGGTDRCAPTTKNRLGACRPCTQGRTLAAYHAAKATDPARYLAHKLRSRASKFGVNPEQQRHLFDAQGRVCRNAGCGRAIDLASAHLDHDHSCCHGDRSCGHCIRGFTCPGCNYAAGFLMDSPAKARGLAAYLDENPRPVIPDIGTAIIRKDFPPLHKRITEAVRVAR
jgi:hypothetical protein